MLRYYNYNNLNIDKELDEIEFRNHAEIVLEPNNKNCLFILGLLFANGVNIRILNEEDLIFEETNKSFTLMTYVWSKIGDVRFPTKDRSNIKTELDKRIEIAKQRGTKIYPIENNPIDNKIFLICPVRNASKKQKKWIEDFVEEKDREGYIVHAPHLHTNQIDPLGGYNICKQNAKAIATSEEIDIYYDKSSTGSIFDLGVAYALHKPLVLLNEEEIQFDDRDFIDSIIKNWPCYTKKKRRTK